MCSRVQESWWFFRDYFGIEELVTQRSCNGQTAFGNQYNSYLHRVALIILIHKVTFIISIGL